MQRAYHKDLAGNKTGADIAIQYIDASCAFVQYKAYIIMHTLGIMCKSPALLSCLPALPRQLTHPPCDLGEANLEPRPPPLTVQPLPLQPASLMKLLLRKVTLYFVPRNQTGQHANAPHKVPAPAAVQVDGAPICRVQAWIVAERFLLLGRQGGGIIWLVGERGVEHAVWQSHGIEIQARRAASAGTSTGTEFRAEDVVGAGCADFIARRRLVARCEARWGPAGWRHAGEERVDCLRGF